MKDRRQRGRGRAERRGVLLLVVLSMLVLFLLLGTTFLLTSGQYRTASKIVEKAHRTTFQPADLLERALMQLVRDTNNSSSVIRYHSLLRDMYGVDGFVGRVMVDPRQYTGGNTTPGMPAVISPRYAGVDIVANGGRGSTMGQVVEFYVVDMEPENPTTVGSTLADDNAVGLVLDSNGLPVEHQLATTDGYYEGCLLTMLSGPCRGQTVRVLDYDYFGETTVSNFRRRMARFRVLTPQRVDGKPLSIAAGNVLSDFIQNTNARTIGTPPQPLTGIGHSFIVNGRPFSGAGVGLNPLAMSSANPEAPLPRLSALELFAYDGSNGYGLERALIPNPVHYFEAANVSLNPAMGIDPWLAPASLGRNYQSGDFLPITRGFVASGEPSYNAATTPLYKTFAGPGDTNESYDAPDTQNMALAMQSLEPRIRGRVVNSNGVSQDPDAYYASASGAPAYLDLEGVTIPSFHRPGLANFWFHRFWKSSWLQTIIPDPDDRARAILEPYNAAGLAQHGLNEAQAAQIALLKRKFLLRPLREDHPNFDGSNPLSRYGTEALRAVLGNGTTLPGGDLVNGATGEITFPFWEAVGPWDVDNDGDGVNDSIWVDIGLPVQQTEDGRWYKPLVAMLVEDLDGRLNLNAHGNEADMAQENHDASSGFESGGNPVSQLNAAQDLRWLNNAPALRPPLTSSNQLPGGVGWGVAETSLRPVLSPSLPTLDAMNGSALTGNAQFDDYARMLYGRPDPVAAGRTATAALRESVTFGRQGTLPGSTPMLPLTKPGRTFPIDPMLTAPATRAQTLSAVRDQRTPYDFAGTPRYTAAETSANGYEALSGFSSAPDFGGRYAVGLSGAGASVDEPRSTANIRSFDPMLSRTAPLTWRELATSAPDDSPYELDLSIGARNRPPTSLDDVRRSYDPNGTGLIQPGATPISDDAPFSAAELERILRAFDGDAEKLPDRLWKLVDGFDPVKKAAANRLLTAGNDEPGFTPSSLQLVIAGAEAAVARRQVTTDSWDLPVPNENLYDRLLLGADGKPGVPEFQSLGTWVNSITLPADDDGDGLMDEGDEAIANYNAAGSHIFVRADGTQTPRTYDELFNAGCDDYVVVMRRDPPKNGRLIDYLKYRITLEMLRNGGVTFNDILTNRPAVDQLVDRILFGGELAASAPAERSSVGGLLSPELLAGRRMDLNRPFGDGRDNNGNGIVDEVEEAGEPFADINGNGRWDAGEPYLDLDRNNQYTQSQDYLWVDTNGDGIETPGERRSFRHIPLHETFVDRNGVRIYNPQMARQLFARHLYCLMLALTDENYLAPYDSEDPQVLHYLDPLSGSVVGTGGASQESSEAFRIAFDLQAVVFATEIADGSVTANHTAPLPDPLLESRRLLVINRARQLAQRKLTCRRIAQWAVNVVDFRDPDSIQTAFEYDENPWDGWNVVDTLHNQVYPLDGDLTTDENWMQRREITGGAFTPPTPTNVEIDDVVRNGAPLTFFPPHKDRTRGVVWGAERPEVLLTEGVAWHDRRLEDRENAEPDPLKKNYRVTELQAQNRDDDLDQLRKPKGYAYVEAYNPHLGDDQRPAELYSHVNRRGEVASSPGVRLDRLSNGVQDPTATVTDAQGRILNRTHSPVWRIAVVEEHPLVRNASVQTGQAGLAGEASDDPPMQTNSNSYRGISILNGPWIYGTDALGTSQDPTLPAPVLPSAYVDFYERKLNEANFALSTKVEQAAGVALTDADGVGVSTGVIERAPTVPDTSFPTFDRFAQPSSPTRLTKNLPITGKVLGPGATQPSQITRGFLQKPTTFIERAYYMTGAEPAVVSGTDKATGDPTNPGLWVPLLTYDVPALFQGTQGRIDTEQRQVGVVYDSGTGLARVHASKFAAAFDRLGVVDGARTQSYEEILAGDSNAPVGFAPLLPGRRAIIGTTGDQYRIEDPANAIEPADRVNPFDGDMARRLIGRYATIFSMDTLTPGDPKEPPAVRSVRRLEMIPNPDPNRHQFAIRMNGLNESTSVVTGGNAANPSGSFNLTGGEATGQADATLAAAPPVIVIPIDHFSISEPLDEYLVRQFELDPTLSLYATPNYDRLHNSTTPVEEYFARQGVNGDPTFFDEPFDVLPELIENQTTPNYRSVHLERLANPLLPWNPPPMRPDGKLIAQHNAALPVNPYLPVDAQSLDLTAFNSYTNAEGLIPQNPGNAPTQGPEQRHKYKRDFNANLNSHQTVIGFASNERGRPSGPFPLMWLMEPSRLMWKQSRGSTLSEIAHNLAAKADYNGYLSREADELTNIGTEGTAYDSAQLNDSYYPAPYSTTQYIEVAWRLTLGFSDWMSGEFHTGSALRWLNEGGGEGPIESIDLDGDRNGGDLASRPEINTELPTQTLAANGRPDAFSGAGPSGSDAKAFMQSYLLQRAAEQGTTPEFAWPNRPLASAGELLQVPAWGGSRMLTYYSVFNWQFTQNPHFSRRTQVNPYDGEGVIFHDGLDFVPNENPIFDGDFSNDGPTDTITDVNGVVRPQAGSTNVIRFRDMLGHFGHLMNFFQTSRFPAIAGAFKYSTDAGPDGAPNNEDDTYEEYVVPRGASHFYRVLDYVCVPSRYTATDTILNTEAFSDPAMAVGDARQELAAPFNRVDNYREPGRVNLNTIAGRRNPAQPRDHWSEVYDGLMQRVHDDSVVASGSLIKQGHLGPAWRDVALSRRGYVQSRFDPTRVPTIDNAGLAADAQNQVDYSPMRMHPDFPTLFANPFRAPGEGANVPLASMVQTGVDATMLRAHPLSPGADGAWGRRGLDNPAFTSGQNNGNRNDAVEAGNLAMQLPSPDVVQRLHADTVLARLLPDPSGADSSRRGAVPDTFMDDAFRSSTGPSNGPSPNPRNVPPQNPVLNTEISKRSTAVPLFSGASLEPSIDTERNSTQRYLPIQRMANLATTRSNVYAVWITVGFFEVKQVNTNSTIAERYAMTDNNGDNVYETFTNDALRDLFFRVYPDGWTLGQEIGRDIGEDVRHRGFYVIDRSRPVAFKPGDDANVSETVLVRRRIQ
ncbi:hypothetical protein [Botrimarina mediterranea]|uniref:Uncharacterized protein n=1 Tax=Botrimarina mediterranea TaxID=2528022 RepID=A0A518K2X6_9BACT|nr:hypothetical protein [Botrimarina mediterranea]QDV72152.1 hypothetical protein Spa11_03240 [Botrimarina mediterranea]